MCQDILAVLRLKGMLQDANTAAHFMRGPDRGEESMNAVSQLLVRMSSNRPSSGGGGSFGEGEPSPPKQPPRRPG